LEDGENRLPKKCREEVVITADKTQNVQKEPETPTPTEKVQGRSNTNLAPDSLR